MIDKDVLNLPDNEIVLFLKLYARTHQADKPYRHEYLGRVILLYRGQIVKSIAQLGKFWDLSVDKVRGILKRWEKAGLIRRTILGKGKKSITHISMYLIDEEEVTHNVHHNKSAENERVEEVEPRVLHQQNKNLKNKKTTHTTLLNPDIFGFGLINLDSLKSALIEGIEIPPIKHQDIDELNKSDMLNALLVLDEPKVAANILFLYSYIRELNRIYLPYSGAKSWRMNGNDYENLSYMLNNYNDLESVLFEVSIIFDEWIEYGFPHPYVSVSYITEILARKAGE